MALKNYLIVSAVKRFFLIFLALVQGACSSTQIIRDEEYFTAQQYFKNREFGAALESFPTKEKNGFITTLEKNWIRLWNGEAKPEELKKLSRSLDERKVFRISEEASTFFLRETEEGYFPSEHEVILLHLIAAMAYLDNKDQAAARIEIKKAAEVVQENYNEKEEIFDDPALRLWLATLWIAVGEWAEAQVDFRRIHELTQHPDARRWADMDRPPKDWHLILYQSSVRLVWADESSQPSFVLGGEEIPQSPFQFSVAPWYDWHLKRNNAVRETLLTSNYMAQYVGIKSRSSALKTAGYTAGGTLMLTGFAVGTFIVVGTLYLLAQMGSSAGSSEGAGYLIGGGVLIGGAIWDEGKSIATEAARKATDDEREDFRRLQNYRFVRFLPQRIGLSSSAPNSNLPQKIYRFPNQKTQVTISLDVGP